MLKNDLFKDYEELLIIKGKRKNRVGEEAGMSRANQYRMWQGRIVNPRYIRLLEELGYDIEVSYVER